MLPFSVSRSKIRAAKSKAGKSKAGKNAANLYEAQKL
jgi:hypothetical protein